MSDPVKKSSLNVGASGPSGSTGPTGPTEKTFISEGVREEIERTGEAVDPATGRKLTKSDLA
jgi:hypothetical protein